MERRQPELGSRWATHDQVWLRGAGPKARPEASSVQCMRISQDVCALPPPRILLLSRGGELLAVPGSRPEWPRDGGTLEHWGAAGHLLFGAALCDEIERLAQRGVTGEVASWRRLRPAVATPKPTLRVSAPSRLSVLWGGG